MEPQIELRGVSFHYGTRPILEDINIHIHHGQFLALLGPSGSGKTTLLRLLLGLLKPSRGTVYMDGTAAGTGAPLTFGYVPQIDQVDWNFPATVEQVVWMGLRRSRTWYPWPTRTERDRIAALLEQLAIPDLQDRHIGALSGGQQQRVFIARALVSEPAVLVLDEPTSDMDVHTIENTLHLLADLNQTGQTIVMSTHDVNAALAHLPWVICVNRTIVAQGPPDRICRKDILDRTYRSDLVVVRRDGQIFVHERPHAHTLADMALPPVEGHAPFDGPDTGDEAV